MEHKGHTQLKRTLVWIAMSDADFCFHFGYGEQGVTNRSEVQK